jgi:hypothetical protein
VELLVEWEEGEGEGGVWVPRMLEPRRRKRKRRYIHVRMYTYIFLYLCMELRLEIFIFSFISIMCTIYLPNNIHVKCSFGIYRVGYEIGTRILNR